MFIFMVWRVNAQKIPLYFSTVCLYTCLSLLDNGKAGITLVLVREQMSELYMAPMGNLT